jgi:hypothetical protein
MSARTIARVHQVVWTSWWYVLGIYGGLCFSTTYPGGMFTAWHISTFALVGVFLLALVTAVWNSRAQSCSTPQ